MNVYYHRTLRTPEQVQADKAKAAQTRDEFQKRMAAQEKAARGTFMQRAAQYFKAEAKHAAAGPASARVVRHRIGICMGCTGRVDEMDGLKDEGGVGFCTKCGCAGSRRSQLSVKLTIAGTACPVGKFPAVEGSGGGLATTFEALRGIATTFAATLRKSMRLPI